MKISILLCLLSLPVFAMQKKIELKQDFFPLAPEGPTDLWIPVPMDMDNYQKVLSQKFHGNADLVKVEKIGSVSLLHAHWNRASHAELHVVSVIELQDHLGPTKDIKNQDAFLRPSAHVQTDGIVHETATKIIAGLTDDDKKAEAIYNWIVEKTLRDPNTRGCGLGDVKTTLTAGNFSGKCADLNSLFVGLARASGVPAREVFGLRVDSSNEFPSLGKTGEVSKAQHCRAEYYSRNKKSWIPVDPADVRKAILEEKLTLADPKIEKMRHKFFGYWEGNWAVFNYGRDFKISTGDKKIEVNYFMYPLLRSPTASPDGMDPKEVSYTLSSQILKN